MNFCSPYFFNGRSIFGLKQIQHIHQYIMHLIVLLMTDGILVRNVIFYLYNIALNKEKFMVEGGGGGLVTYVSRTINTILYF